MKNILSLKIMGLEKTEELSFEVLTLINFGYGGRDSSQIQAHIDEVKELNLPVPGVVPTVFPLSNHLITTEKLVQVQHGKTNGEVEFVLLYQDNNWYVGVSSDHTDRYLESYAIPHSKQAYPNFMANEVWKVEDVMEHWDQIQINSWITDNGERKHYQSGTFADILPLEFWKKRLVELNVLESGVVVLTGTVATIERNLLFGEKFEYEIADPILNRKISSFYNLVELMPPLE
ncbi:DUF2848 family protein [Bacillus sp. ISL-47]|uniref:DUF2848 family protein n=1 Tax=Bacillus sp. ISL-47 TaxID=2819130 RepID=UPI001BE509C7|nr:DUF2848 family protein [Bacillus sp. ISL-47]MBT2686797.1 DUF2848 family protein [Bacillus sp. ISL-47]MBT2706850.1 DUF2848 family protein [Pseudomonas sp. ISL-84]